jgi:hypothetical protein
MASRVLLEDSERIFCRCVNSSGTARTMVLLVVPAAEHPSSTILDRLAHEFGLKDELHAPYAVRPIELNGERDRQTLMLEDPGSEPLARLLGSPLEVDRFLTLPIAVAGAGTLEGLCCVHRT